MSNLTLFSYEGAELRTVTIDGEPWFVAPDACRMLTLTNTTVAMRMVDDGDKRNIPRSDTLNFPKGIAPQVQSITVVNESGMWALILQSNKEQAQKVRRWITGTVLPEIRKTGTYGAAPLQGAELLAAAVLESQKVIEQRDARIFQLEQTITEQSPKVTYVDTYVADEDLLSFSTVASTSNITEKALRELLTAKDWIYVQADSRWSNTKGRKVERNRYSEKATKKRYFRRVENHEAPRFRGSEVMHTLKVTPLGAEAIARLVAKECVA